MHLHKSVISALSPDPLLPCSAQRAVQLQLLHSVCKLELH